MKDQLKLIKPRKNCVQYSKYPNEIEGKNIKERQSHIKMQLRKNIAREKKNLSSIKIDRNLYTGE